MSEKLSFKVSPDGAPLIMMMPNKRKIVRTNFGGSQNPLYSFVYTIHPGPHYNTPPPFLDKSLNHYGRTTPYTHAVCAVRCTAHNVMYALRPGAPDLFKLYSKSQFDRVGFLNFIPKSQFERSREPTAGSRIHYITVTRTPPDVRFVLTKYIYMYIYVYYVYAKDVLCSSFVALRVTFARRHAYAGLLNIVRLGFIAMATPTPDIFRSKAKIWTPLFGAVSRITWMIFTLFNNL